MITLTKETETLHPATAEKVREMQKEEAEWYDDTPVNLTSVTAGTAGKKDRNQKIKEILAAPAEEYDVDDEDGFFGK